MLLQFGLELNVLLLELADQVLLQLDLLDHLHQVCVGFGSLVAKRVSVFGDLCDTLNELLDVLLVVVVLVNQVLDGLLLLQDIVAVLVVRVFYLLQRLLHHVAIAHELHDVGLLDVCLFSEPLNFSSEGADSVLGSILLLDGIKFLRLQVFFLLLNLHDSTGLLVDLLLRITNVGLRQVQPFLVLDFFCLNLNLGRVQLVLLVFALRACFLDLAFFFLKSLVLGLKSGEVVLQAGDFIHHTLATLLLLVEFLRDLFIIRLERFFLFFEALLQTVCSFVLIQTVLEFLLHLLQLVLLFGKFCVEAVAFLSKISVLPLKLNVGVLTVFDLL